MMKRREIAPRLDEFPPDFKEPHARDLPLEISPPYWKKKEKNGH